MDHVIPSGDLPALRRPVLIAAFEGWNDAGEAASHAVSYLRRSLDARPLAHIDAEDFFDFQLVRPTVRLSSEGARIIEWPRASLSWAPLRGTERDVVLLEGAEPNLRWRTFAGEIVGLSQELGIETVVSLGALQTDAPHTRPVPLTAASADPVLAARLCIERTTYEGPTGIVGVLHDAFARADIPALSLWAGVPHYLAGAAFLPAALRLVDESARLLDADLPLGALATDAAAQARDITALVAEDEDLAEYVAELEQRAAEGAEAAPGDHELPSPTVSGEELAAELERFLRDRPES